MGGGGAGGRGGCGGLDLLPKWHRKYLPSATWPSRRILSVLPSPFFLPSLLRSAERQPEPPRSARQGAKSRDRKKKFPLALPEVTEVQLPGKTGLCIFKTSEGATWPSSKAQVRGKKIESCQMIFVLSNDLGGGEGTLRTLASGLCRSP